jgi:hypothetical protein
LIGNVAGCVCHPTCPRPVRIGEGRGVAIVDAEQHTTGAFEGGDHQEDLPAGTVATSVFVVSARWCGDGEHLLARLLEGFAGDGFGGALAGVADEW